jgi:hypothetical protein
MIFIYGRTSGLLGYADTQPFFMKFNTNFVLQAYKAIKYESSSQFKSLALGYTSDSYLYGIIGTQDHSNSNTKTWLIVALDSSSFYEEWAQALEDPSFVLNVASYSDYGSPKIKYIRNSVFACIYYQYSVSGSTTYYESALIRLNPTTGAMTSNIEW